MERYLTLARDASAQGDRVTAENCYQHAEHYFRLLNAYNQSNGVAPRRPFGSSSPAEDQADQSFGNEEGEEDSSSESEAHAEEDTGAEPLVEAVG
jgi:hypothetical protein